jgi:hypothetical protein
MRSLDDELAEALRERQRILERVTWWDLHRYEVLFPIAIVLFGSGYGIGYAARTFFGAPERTEVIAALASLLIAGQLIERRFSARHLDRIDARIARLERTRRGGP